MNKIESGMPFGNPDACTGDCALDTAAFIYRVLNNRDDPPSTTTPAEKQFLIDPVDKANAKVYLGSGTSQEFGSTVKIATNFPAYSGEGVDVMIAALIPNDPDLYAIDSSGRFVPFDGMTLYASGLTESQSTTILLEEAVGDRIGTWYIAYMIYPKGNPSVYDLAIYSYQAM